MTFLKKLGCAAAIALAAGAAHADNIMNHWDFNPTGGGKANAQDINEYLDINGAAFIQLTATGGSSFSFAEHGAFNTVQADGNGALFPVTFPGGNISITLDAYGTGTFGGSFKFTGGTVRMYQNTVNQYNTTVGMYGADQGTLIGTFNVLMGGGGRVDGQGNPTDNGQVSVFAQAKVGQLKAGYFFNDNGVDMSTLDNTAFAFTNANTIGSPTKTQVGEIACEFAKFTPACSGTYANAPGQYFFVSNNGQFKFADVPEPGSVALFGIALFGLGAMRRRVK
jgi:hypothetical protein